MSRIKKILIGLGIVLIVIILFAYLYIRSLATKGLPEYDGEVALKGLENEVVVYRDQYAIPHIYAKSEEDLYRVTGYVMAQDRLWQMDLIRRATFGRLSEMFGGDLVDADHLLRSLRIPEKSRMLIDQTDEYIISYLEAFANGVNQYMESHKDKLPLEFNILGYSPDPWKAEHCANLIGYMAWDLTMPWAIEVMLYNISEKVGEEMCRELIPDMDSQVHVVYPDFVGKISSTDLENSLLTGAEKLEELGLVVFSASNNWAVSGKKSVTGMPLFSNDMHLELNAPGIWYQMHQCVEGGINVTGVALPGQPCVVAGHNDYIAWGMTNVMVDDMDFYLEKVNPENRYQYKFNGEWKEMDVRKEIIKISGGEEVERELLFTHRGPIVSKFKDVEEAISMRWLGNDFSNEIRSVYLLNHARNWDEFKDAASTFISVSQNIAYADIEGNIGIYCCAGVPIRKKGNGIAIAPGWTDEYDWDGVIPFEKLPHSFNPECGYVSSANNRSMNDDAPFQIPQWPALHYRIARIRDMLEEKEKFSADDFIRMQKDWQSKLVEEMRDALIAEIEKSESLTPLEQKSLGLLSAWDGRETKESAATLIFEEFYGRFLENLLLDELDSLLYKQYISTSYLSRFAIHHIWSHPDSRWCDDVTTDKVENFTDQVQKSFREAVTSLAERYGNNSEKWRWGDEHVFVLAHPMGGVKILDAVFSLNRGPYEVSGGNHTVSPYKHSYTNPYTVDYGSSHRHIYDLADWDRSLSVIPTGNSGIPASDHYCDQTELYLEHEYHTDYITRNLIEKEAKYKQVFIK